MVVDPGHRSALKQLLLEFPNAFYERRDIGMGRDGQAQGSKLLVEGGRELSRILEVQLLKGIQYPVQLIETGAAILGTPCIWLRL
jgi:hypothetical protein